MHTLPAHPSHLVLATLLLGACSSQSPTSPVDAGGSFSLPDAAPVCVAADGSVAGTSDASDPLCTPGLPKVSYTNDVVPILAQCSGEVCHAAWSAESTVGVPSVSCCDHRLLIAPGKPSASHLIQAVRGADACVPQMPLDEGALADSRIATLVAWVCQGANEN